MQANIGHDSRYYCVSKQPPLLLEGQAAQRHHLIAVDLPALLVHSQAAVRVSVKSNAQVVSAGGHHGGQSIHVGGAAFVVDVHPIGVGIDNIGHQLRKAVKQAAGGGVSRAVGAVHQDAQSMEILMDTTLQMVNIVL